MLADKTKSQNYIDGIRSGNPQVIRQISADHLKAIVQLVETNSGTKEDAYDVFQEGLVTIYQKVQHADFQLTSSFLTFFYAICRNIWYNKLRKKSKKEVTLDDKMLSMLKEDADPILEKSEQYYLYRKMFLKLGEDCQHVLDMFLRKISMQEIMQKMGYGSISYTKKRKFICKEKLVKLIQNDPSFQELKTN